MDIMSLWLIPGLLGSSKYGCRISDSVDISSTQDECSLAISRRHMILFRKKIKTQNVGKVVDFIYVYMRRTIKNPVEIGDWQCQINCKP